VTRDRGSTSPEARVNVNVVVRAGCDGSGACALARTAKSAVAAMAVWEGRTEVAARSSIGGEVSPRRWTVPSSPKKRSSESLCEDWEREAGHDRDFFFAPQIWWHEMPPYSSLHPQYVRLSTSNVVAARHANSRELANWSMAG
jgi:hypothetical protein